MKSIEFPVDVGLTLMGDQIFSGCKSLTSMIITSSLDSINLDSIKNSFDGGNVKPGEICEQIYYHISAKRLNSCVIKISTKSLQNIS